MKRALACVACLTGIALVGPAPARAASIPFTIAGTIDAVYDPASAPNSGLGVGSDFLVVIRLDLSRASSDLLASDEDRGLIWPRSPSG